MLTLDKTFCFGRYQVAVPRHSKTSAGYPQHYDGYDIVTEPEFGPPELKKLIADELKFIRNSVNELYISKEISPGLHVIVAGSPPLTQDSSSMERAGIRSIGGYPTTTTIYYLQPNNYIQRIGPVRGKQPLDQTREQFLQRTYNFMGAFTKRIEPLGNDDIPTRPGVCLTGGFIADDGSKNFSSSASVAYSDVPGLTLTIASGMFNQPGEGDLLSRRPSQLLNLLTGLNYSELRSGSRTVNGMAGQEVVSRWNTGKGDAYLFIWEKTDGGVHAEMRAGSGGAQGVRKEGWQASPLSEKDALVLWDATLDTLKLRVTQ